MILRKVVKKITVQTLLVFSFWILCSPSFSQDFPKSYLGHYTGEMIITSTSNLSDTAHVDFYFTELVADSVWGYKMIFVNDKYGKVVKDYALVAKQKGDFTNFIFDELNGIKMEMTFLNHCLYGMYEVQNVNYISTMRILDSNLLVDLMMVPCSNPLITKYDEDETFVVSSSKPTLQQTVLLRKME